MLEAGIAQGRFSYGVLWDASRWRISEIGGGQHRGAARLQASTSV